MRAMPESRFAPRTSSHAPRPAESATHCCIAPRPLDSGERTALRTFTVAAAAMELLGALAEWHLHGNHSPETGYLIDLGLAGMRDYGQLS